MLQKMFLPMTSEEVAQWGWDCLDIILISGDAYVDHPAFGSALLGRYLVSLGYKVGIIAQPDWRNNNDFMKLGKPKLFFGVSAGNLDSMVANYTAHKHRRREDAYSPGRQRGLRPDRATIVYSNRLRESYPEVPIVLGGLEASMRRIAHYDYWSDELRRSILFDAKADLLVYGMGERQIKTIAENLSMGLGVESLYGVKGIAYKEKDPYITEETVVLPSFAEITNKDNYNLAYKLFYSELDPFLGRTIVQENQDGWYVVVNPPQKPLDTKELDSIYDLPFLRRAHPIYDKVGGVPALRTVQFSITTHRGCLGECYFCSLALHQGRVIQSRSEESILKEAKEIASDKEFGGTIDDAGGPSANLYKAYCNLQTIREQRSERGTCKDRHCLTPKICPNLTLNQKAYTSLLKNIRTLPGIKRVFVQSGVRFDVALKDKEFLKELALYHVGGQLKVAPEHLSDNVLKQMNKPEHKVYQRFCQVYDEICKSVGKESYIIPYLISSHPGSTLDDAIDLAVYLKRQGRYFEQVQDFIPLPLTVSSAMWYTGKNPFTGKRVHIANSEEKEMQRALLQFQNQQNWPLVRKALRTTGRDDLIGYGPKCLVPPEKTDSLKNSKNRSPNKLLVKGNKRKKRK